MNPKDLMYTQRRFSLLHLISFVVFIAVLVYGGYSFMAKTSLEASSVDADTQLANLQEQVAQLEAQNLSEVNVAGQLIEQVEVSEIKWSGMLTDLLSATPLDIYYASYSGSEDGRVSVSGLGENYYSVAGLIDVLTADSAFDNVFVSSVASATSDEAEMASFGLTFVYDDAKVSR